MNYRNIIKSQKARRYILNILSFIPDRPMLQMQYYIQLGRKLNLKNPKRYTEKIQLYKLKYRNPKMIECVDKWDVREYIREKGYGSILNHSYGVYENVDEIDFASLPEQYVLKDTLGGGGNSIVIVKERLQESELLQIKTRLKQWMNRPFRRPTDGREWPYYSGKKHRIIIESFIDEASEGLTDYKFFCFHGEIACVYVIADRKLGQHGSLAIMSRDFTRLPFQSATQAIMENDPIKPINYEYMIKIAEDLSKDFPHVRVDLYNVNGTVIFGELTFFGASGYQKFEPDTFDYILGEKFLTDFA